MYYRRRERGEDIDFTPEEMASCMKNEKPGTFTLKNSDARVSRTCNTLFR
jgi:hypothetical protein